MEMTYLEGPHECGRARYKPFAERGFQGPYPKWMDYDRDIFYNTMDKFDIPYTEETMFLSGQTVSYIVDFMNKEGPFDGFCGFSQGAGATRTFYLMN